VHSVAIGLAFSPWLLTPAKLLAWAAELLWSAILFLNVRDDELGTRKKMGGSHTHIFSPNRACSDSFNKVRVKCTIAVVEADLADESLPGNFAAVLR
jgi:hypothetical protein